MNKNKEKEHLSKNFKIYFCQELNYLYTWNIYIYFNFDILFVLIFFTMLNY